jgi:hypothetical protein
MKVQVLWPFQQFEIVMWFLLTNPFLGLTKNSSCNPGFAINAKPAPLGP